MPGPPPPPPPGPPPFLGGASAPDGRGALLQSIRQGAKLKKTVTVDKSAPAIPSNNSSSPRNGLTSSPMPNGMPLGGLFAGGMPKLKATGLRAALPGANPTTGGSPSPARAANSVQDQLKRQLHNPSDTKTRGPPPPAPVRHISADEGRPAKPLTVHLNGAQPNQSSLHANAAKLHRKSKSNANLSALDAPDASNLLSKPAISHGKPHLAPKPPLLNGKPAPPSKLSLKTSKAISRAQSMRAPRSPSPQSPPALDVSSKFGTVRNISSMLGQSLSSLNASPRPRPALAGRPSVPPPSVPPPPTPKTAPVKPPSHAPPPPPAHAPPPPPHKTLSQPSRPPPAIPGNNANANPPPPPPRHSSMRDVQHHQTARRLAADFDEKFRSAFAAPERFPRPPPYRNVVKSYSNKQVGGKQQAPLPPPPSKTWSSTSAC